MTLLHLSDIGENQTANVHFNRVALYIAPRASADF